MNNYTRIFVYMDWRYILIEKECSKMVRLPYEQPDFLLVPLKIEERLLACGTQNLLECGTNFIVGS